MNIELQNLSLSFRKTHILKGINVLFASGTVTSVLGANGSGKSSLLKCLAGLVPYDDKIRTTPDNFGKISYVPQRPVVPVGMTLAEFVLLGRSEFTKWYFSETSTDRAKCQEAIASLSLGELAGRFVETLSGGEFQRAVLARAVAQEASVLLLDEPTSALDIVNQVEVMSYLANLQKKLKLTVIIALHDLNLALNYSDKTIILKDGSVSGFGDTEQVMNKENLSDAYKSPIEIRSQEDGTKTVLIKYDFKEQSS